MTTVTIQPVGDLELHVHYRGEHKPQDCFIELDCGTGVLTARANPQIGNAVPFPVYHRHVLRWGIPCLKGPTANAILEDIRDMAQMVVDGYTSEWDNHNHVGHYNDNAQEAMEVIRLTTDVSFSEAEIIQAWKASDWFSGMGGWKVQARQLGLTTDMLDDDLEKMASKLEEETSVDILVGTKKHLEWLVDMIRDEREADYDHYGDLP